MPKPRKPLMTTFRPPERIGWYAYSHNGGPMEAVYFDQIGLRDAKNRYEMALLVDLDPVDVYSTRQLKVREMAGPRKGRSE